MGLFDIFKKSKIIGTTPGGKPYLRPNDPYRHTGLGQAFKEFSRHREGDASNISPEDIKVMEGIIKDSFAKKSSTHFSYEEKLAIRRKMEQARLHGDLSINDVGDLKAILDTLLKD